MGPTVTDLQATKAFLDWQGQEPHRAAPGPDYWAWRCRVCSKPVANRRLHPRLGGLAREVRRWRARMPGRSW